jgi:hypothetical protein
MQARLKLASNLKENSRNCDINTAAGGTMELDEIQERAQGASDSAEFFAVNPTTLARSQGLLP